MQELVSHSLGKATKHFKRKKKSSFHISEDFKYRSRKNMISFFGNPSFLETEKTLLHKMVMAVAQSNNKDSR